MKKKRFALKSTTDLKVFLLFLLEQIRYPIDRTTLIRIISENTEEIVVDYDVLPSFPMTVTSGLTK